MRLIDADAEIAKIEQEIQRIKTRIKEWEDNRADRSRYDVDAKITDLKRNIADAQGEIKCLKNYSTAYDVNKVVEQLEGELEIVVTQYPLHGKYIKKSRSIEIVKAGGLDEQ